MKEERGGGVRVETNVDRSGEEEEEDGDWGEITQSSGEGGEMRGEAFPLAHIKDMKKKTNRKTCLT